MTLGLCTFPDRWKVGSSLNTNDSMKPSVSILICISSEEDSLLVLSSGFRACINCRRYGLVFLDLWSNVFVKSCTEFVGWYLILYWLLSWISVDFVWNSLSHAPHFARLLVDNRLTFAYRWIPLFWSQVTTYKYWVHWLAENQIFV